MKKLFVLFIIVVVFIAGGYFWWQQNLLPVNTGDKATKIFVIKEGENVRAVAAALKERNLIKNSTVFFLLVKQMNTENKIQAGDFRLSPSESSQQIAQDLTHGVLDIWVTIPEGKRAEEVADIFKDKLPSYNNSWKEKLLANEGHLFPDTYLIPRTVDSTFIMNALIKNFDKHMAALQGNTTYTDKQRLIIASLVEREAKDPQDRPLIASVIVNRLQLNMPLQIDATIQYALGYQPIEQTWWKKNLTADDLMIRSLYNTYQNPGLPPAPICNPGAAALQAAFHPSQTDYLYYLADKSGHSHFAKTLEEHNANIKKYGL